LITLQQLFDDEVAMLGENHLLLYLLVLLVTARVIVDRIDESTTELTVSFYQLLNQK